MPILTKMFSSVAPPGTPSFLCLPLRGFCLEFKFVKSILNLFSHMLPGHHSPGLRRSLLLSKTLASVSVQHGWWISLAAAVAVTPKPRSTCQ